MEVARNPHLFQCEKCYWGRHCDEDNRAPRKDHWHVKVKGLSYYKTDYCLLNQMDRGSHEIVKLYNHYEKGNFMVQGSILEQPHFYRQSMELIQGILNHGSEKP